MNIEVEKDETILSLNGKLFQYKQKLKQLEEMRRNGNGGPNVASVIEKINKAISITLNLIDKRRSDILQSQEGEFPLRIFHSHNFVEVVIIEKEFNAGEYVFAKKGGCTSWYIAVITQVMKREEKIDHEYAVEFVGEVPPVHNLVSLRNKSIKEFSLPRKYLRNGVSVLAVYAKDGKYYKALIDKLDDVGWLWVRFKGYSGVQKTKEEHIRLLASFGNELYGVEQSNDKITGKKRKREGNDNLSEKQLRELGRIEKKRKMDNILGKRKKSWKSFMEKGQKKKMRGVLSSAKLKKKKKKKVSNFGILTINNNNSNNDNNNNDTQMKQEDPQERNRKRKGAVMQRPVRKSREAENVLEEMEILRRKSEDDQRSRGRGHYDNNDRYDRYDRRRGRGRRGGDYYDDRGGGGGRGDYYDQRRYSDNRDGRRRDYHDGYRRYDQREERRYYD